MISAILRRHAARIQAEVGWLPRRPDICGDLELAANHIDELDNQLAELQKKLQERS